MPSEYETCFTISGAGDATGVYLLREVTERIKGELLSYTADAATGEDAPDVETGDTEAAGYTRISAERDYPGNPQYRVRLEVRLCTQGDGLEAEVHSRFLSVAESAPPELLAGPPRLLNFIASEFQCAAGPEPLIRQYRYIAEADVESFARESVLNPQRRLPIVAMSEDRHGGTALDPERAQRVLLGVAVVAVLPGRAATALTRYLGRWYSSSSGALQILWPGCRYEGNGDGPRVIRRGSDVWNNVAETLRGLQRDCIANAPESHFDSAFSDARVSVILERNRLLETRQRILSEQSAEASTDEADTLRRDLRRQEIAAREANRKWQNALQTVAKLEQELAAARDELDGLSAPQSGAAQPEDEREITRKLRAENGELREERDRLRATNARLNDDNQLLRQRELRNRSEADACVIRLARPHPGNVTILNYAVNLYRDPMRRYIISNLDARDETSLKEILRMSVEFSIGAKEKPEALIDVNDFHNIVTDNRAYFANSKNLSWSLRQIKDVRNRAAHPPPGGISDGYTQDGLTRIAEALESIGAKQEYMEIARLRDRIHSN